MVRSIQNQSQRKMVVELFVEMATLMEKLNSMSNIKLFEHKKIRSHWNAAEEKWYFSVVDIIEVLTDSPNPQVYWRVMKKRLKDEGNETVTNCNALKMEAADGKLRITDVADTEQLFRLIQSIPSPKAEAFKRCGKSS